MTEFTIMGNYMGKTDTLHEFYIKEGRHSYTIHVNKTSTLLDELEQITPGTRVKTTGIIMKSIDDEDILVSNRVTLILGENITK